MINTIRDQVVNAVVLETVSSLVDDIYSFYGQLPGRHPSGLSKNISETLHQIDSSRAKELIKDVVDRTTFSLLYLLENDFKNYNIEVYFTSGSETSAARDCRLVESYRMRVRPGGNLVLTDSEERGARDTKLR
jgi:hypothetical protein